ncbi:unnamed protein product [Parajaminaea phylloscopi]
MSTRGITRDEALGLIRSRRSQAEPNPGFLEQLDLYERASYQVDLRHAPIRRFLMSKTDVLNGGRVEDLLMSYYPSPAVSPTPSSTGSSRGPLWATMSPLSDATSTTTPHLVRRPSRTTTSSGTASAPGVDLSVSPAMPTNTDELFAKDQAHLRAKGHNAIHGKGADEASMPPEKVNDWATSLSSPHEVLVTRSFGSRRPFNVPSESLRGHESLSNQGSIPKPTHTAFGSTTRLRCRMCRREIAARDHVVEHEVGKGKGAFDMRKRNKDEKGERQSEGFVRRGEAEGGSTAPLNAEQKFGSVKRREASAGSDDSSSTPQSSGSSGPSASGEQTGGDPSHAGLSALSLKPQQEVLLDAQGSGNKPSAMAPTGRPIQSAASLTASLPPHLAALRAGRAPPGAQMAQNRALAQSRSRSENAVATRAKAAATASETPTPVQSEQSRDPDLRGKSSDSMPSGIDGADEAKATDSDSSTQADEEVSKADADADALPPLLPSTQCTSYFLEPLSWMSLPLDGSTLSGRLLCPNSACRHKLGGWDWAGLQCACGAWVTPGFAVLASRVDEVQAGTRTRS